MQKCNLFLQMSGAQVSLKKKGGQACCSYLIILTCDQGHAYLTYQNGEQLYSSQQGLCPKFQDAVHFHENQYQSSYVYVYMKYTRRHFAKVTPQLIRCLRPQLCNLFLTLRIDEVYESATTLSGEMENISKISALLHFFFAKQKQENNQGAYISLLAF